MGSHGGRHIYFAGAAEAQAEDDLSFARSVHDREGLPFKSFVFPRNLVGKKDLLTRQGIRVYRGTDHAWHQRIRNRSRLLGRAANLLDKMFPVAPEAVEPEIDGKLINLPGSLLFFGREGIRSAAPPSVMQSKLDKGLARAQKQDGVFHLWFHPSNFWHDTDRQLGTFAAFAERVAVARARGEIEVRPMAAFA